MNSTISVVTEAESVMDENSLLYSSCCGTVDIRDRNIFNCVSDSVGFDYEIRSCDEFASVTTEVNESSTDEFISNDRERNDEDLFERLNRQSHIVFSRNISLLPRSVLEDYKFLASGNRSVVRLLCQKKWEGYCAKVFFSNNNSGDHDGRFRRMFSEAISLKLLQNTAGVPKLMGVVLQPYALVMTRHGNSLSTWVQGDNPPAFFVLLVLLESARIVNTVHAKGYTHNDIKGGNICVEVSDEGVVKATVIDWGMTMRIGSSLWPDRQRNTVDLASLENVRRTLHRNIAPVLFYGAPACPSTDAYSMAVLIKDLKEKSLKSFLNDGLSSLVDSYVASNGDRCCMESLIAELDLEKHLREERLFRELCVES